jgi:hypothetical protein
VENKEQSIAKFVEIKAKAANQIKKRIPKLGEIVNPPEIKRNS